ncbi:UbiD family decarboxylase [Streptomyces cellostaticus]|nr:UbiD family decarboxylase [Streptomyces cellostaticus]
MSAETVDLHVPAGAEIVFAPPVARAGLPGRR